MKKANRILWLSLSALLTSLLFLAACSTPADNTDVFFCNVSYDEFDRMNIEETTKSKAAYRAERLYDENNVLLSCRIEDRYTRSFEWELIYNPDGSIAEIRSPSSHFKTIYEYDENGLCVAVTDCDIASENAESTSPTTIYEYDAEGRCTKRANLAPDGEKYLSHSIYSYDEKGNLIEQTNYIDNEIRNSRSMSYDEQGNITKEVRTGKEDHLIGYLIYEYRDNQLAKTVNYNEQEKITEIHEYDEAGNEIRFFEYDSMTTFTTTEIGKCNDYRTENQYDDRGNLTKQSIYVFNDEKEFSQLFEEYVAEYDENDNQTLIAYSAYQEPLYTIRRTFGKDDRCIKSVISNADGHILLEHDGYASVRSYSYLGPDYYDCISYSQSGQVLKRISIESSGTIVASTEYEYDENGQCIKETETIASGYSKVIEVSEGARAFLFTPDGQLILSILTNQNDSESITVYDAANNVIFESEGTWGGMDFELNENALEYSIRVRSDRYHYILFRYENGTIQVEAD